MAEPVVVKFQAHGVPDIQKAYGDILQAAEKAEKAQTAAAERKKKKEIQAADDSVTNQIKAWEKLDRFMVQSRAKSERDVEATARKAVNAWVKAGGDIAKADEVYTNARIKAATRYSQDAQKLAEARATVELKASQRIVSADLKGFDERLKTATNANKQILAVDKWLEAEEQKLQSARRHRKDQEAKEDLSRAREHANIQHREKQQQDRRALSDFDQRLSDHKAAAAQSSASRGMFARAIGSGVATGIGRGVSQSYGLASNVVQGVLGLGGGFGLAQAVTERMTAEKQIQLLSNEAFQEGAPGAKGRRGAGEINDPVRMLKQARAASIESGVDINEIVAGTREYVNRGSDLEGGLANMATFAKIAKVNGASTTDVFKAMGSLRAQNEGYDDASGVHHGGLTAQEGMQMMLDVAAQGRHGAVPLSEIAASAAGIGKNASWFKGDQTTRQRELLGLAQIAIKANSSGAETSSTLSNFATRAAINSDSIGGLVKERGRLVGTADGKTDMASIIGHIFQQAKGDLGVMHKSVSQGGFGMYVRGNKLFQALGEDFEAGKRESLAAGGSESDSIKAGRAAVERKINSAIQAKGTLGNLNAEHGAIMNTTEEKLDQAFRKMRDSVADKLLPSLEKLVAVMETVIPIFADALGQAAPSIVKFLESVGNFVRANQGLINLIAAHPFAAIFAKNIASGLAQAGIGQAVRTKLLELLGGGSIGGGGGASSAVVQSLTGGSKLGKGLGLVAAGGYAAAALAGLGLVQSQEASKLGESDAEQLAQDLKSGKVSSADVRKRMTDAKNRLAKGNTLEDVGNLILSPLLEGAERDDTRRRKDEALVGEGDGAMHLIKALKAAEANEKMASAAERAAKALDKINAPALADPGHNTRNLPPVLTGGAFPR